MSPCRINAREEVSQSVHKSELGSLGTWGSPSGSAGGDRRAEGGGPGQDLGLPSLRGPPGEYHGRLEHPVVGQIYHLDEIGNFCFCNTNTHQQQNGKINGSFVQETAEQRGATKTRAPGPRRPRGGTDRCRCRWPFPEAWTGARHSRPPVGPPSGGASTDTGWDGGFGGPTISGCSSVGVCPSEIPPHCIQATPQRFPSLWFRADDKQCHVLSIVTFVCSGTIAPTECQLQRSGDHEVPRA